MKPTGLLSGSWIGFLRASCLAMSAMRVVRLEPMVAERSVPMSLNGLFPGSVRTSGLAPRPTVKTSFFEPSTMTSCGPIACAPPSTACDGSLDRTRSCLPFFLPLPLSRLTRVMAPVLPKHESPPSGLSMHGPPPPRPASATKRSPLGPTDR